MHPTPTSTRICLIALAILFLSTCASAQQCEIHVGDARKPAFKCLATHLHGNVESSSTSNYFEYEDFKDGPYLCDLRLRFSKNQRIEWIDINYNIEDEDSATDAFELIAKTLIIKGYKILKGKLEYPRGAIEREITLRHGSEVIEIEQVGEEISNHAAQYKEWRRQQKEEARSRAYDAGKLVPVPDPTPAETGAR